MKAKVITINKTNKTESDRKQTNIVTTITIIQEQTDLTEHYEDIGAEMLSADVIQLKL